VSIGNLWASILSPIRVTISVWWAMANRADRSPVPVAATVAEVSAGAAVLAANYKPDPWDGRLDLTEHPERVQWHLERGTLGLLSGLDCDDLAYWAVARLRSIASPCHVLILTDLTGKYSHAVCEAWVDGVHYVIDTAGTHNLAGWPSVSALMQSIYPDARYGGEFRAPSIWRS